MANRRHHPSRDRSSGHFFKLYVLGTALVVAAAILLGCVVFFKINDVQVYIKSPAGAVAPLSEGDRYSAEELMEASGVSIGNNLCLMDKNRTAVNILQKLPYVSHVSIQKKLPGTLILTISQSEAAAAIQAEDGSWWLVDDNCRLLEQSKTSQGRAILTGLTLMEPEVGKQVQVPDGTDPEVPSQELQRDSLAELFQALRSQGLFEMIVTVSADDSSIILDYGGRITVKLPLRADYDYKMRYFSKMLTDYFPQNWSKTDTGLLDMTFSDGHPHLTKNS